VALREHLIDSAAYMRLFTMGLILLLVLRFSPRGLIPELARGIEPLAKCLRREILKPG
jgi:ABC-type branched-subunit amino acid transport system permease subunit